MEIASMFVSLDRIMKEQHLIFVHWQCYLAKVHFFVPEDLWEVRSNLTKQLHMLLFNLMA